jgi:XTP/dITP diphosphohydrolase
MATTNPAKLREVRAILAGLPIALTTLEDHPGLPVAVEDADTFEGNATIKALHYARLVGSWTLAEDSGLAVDALGGAPGVRSARYAGPNADDAANNARLVAELAAVPPEQRSARFCCAVVLASPTEVLAESFATVEGVVIDPPRGANGFGYDPHFYVPQFGVTTAEMPPEQKNRISHRGKAFRMIRPHIERLVGEPTPP